MTQIEIQVILDQHLSAMKSGRLIGYQKCASLISYLHEADIKKALKKHIRTSKNSRVIGKPKAVIEIYNLLNK